MQLFVYGTLKEPGRLRAMLGSAVRWRVIGAGTVGGALYDCGEYPALVASRAPDDVVPGVLLELEDDAVLAQLDAYEGVDSGLYVRAQMEVCMDDGRREMAWGYVYQRSITRLRRISAWPPEKTGARLTGQRPSLSVRSTREEHAMVEKSIELTGTSANSIEDAVNLAVSRAAVTIDGIRRVEIATVSATVEEGSVARWHVTMKVTFAIQDRLHE